MKPRNTLNHLRLLLALIITVLFTWGVRAHAQDGRSPHAPDISYYAGIGEDCCGEDPHPVHGIGTSDGGAVLVGKTAQVGDGWGGFALKIGPPAPGEVGIILDAADRESLHWSLTIGGPRTRSVLLNAAEVAGAIFLVGARADANGLSQMYLAKHNLATGSKVWEMEFAATNEGYTGALEVLQPTINGGIIAGGIINAPQEGLEGFKSFGNPLGGQAEVVYLSPAQVSATTAPQSPTWRRTYDAYETVKAIHPVAGDTPGYILLVGHEDLDPTVVRTDDSGDILWQRTYAGRFEATDLALHYRDGEHAGYTFTGHGGTAGTLDGQLTRIDLEGEQIWAKTFGNPAGGVGPFAGLDRGDPQLIFDECWGLQGLPDGGVVVGCGTGIEGCDLVSDEALRATCLQDPRQTWRGWVARFDGGGEMVWDRLDSFVEPSSPADAADAASEYVAFMANGSILSVVDQGFGIGVLVFEPEAGMTEPNEGMNANSPTDPVVPPTDEYEDEEDEDEEEKPAPEADGEPMEDRESPMNEPAATTGCQSTSDGGGKSALWVLCLGYLAGRRRASSLPMTPAAISQSRRRWRS